MAKSLIIRSLCDICLQDDKETDAETVYVNVRFGVNPDSPRPFVVELCSKHGEDIASAVLALVSLGRPPEDDKAATAPARKTAKTRPDQTPREVTCPECGNVYGTIGALRHHARREHDKSLAAIGLAPANFTCPTCGDGFVNRQGMAAHVRAAHAKQSA
jgi:transcription elongation factor Elf1